jgi:hypothetical protein
MVAGAMSRNVTVQPGFRVAMSSDRPEQSADDGVVAAEKPTCVAVAPLVSAVHWSRVRDQQLSRADFITQLIATAEHVPQTRSVRRATPADAKAAYGASRLQARVQRSGTRTRQIV